MGPAVLYVSLLYRLETIVPSITARAFDRGAAGRAERAGVWAEASAASARTGFHTVREPPERASGLEELSHGR